MIVCIVSGQCGHFNDHVVSRTSAAKCCTRYCTNNFIYRASTCSINNTAKCWNTVCDTYTTGESTNRYASAGDPIGVTRWIRIHGSCGINNTQLTHITDGHYFTIWTHSHAIGFFVGLTVKTSGPCDAAIFSTDLGSGDIIVIAITSVANHDW